MVMVLPKAMHAPMRIERLPAPMTDSTARIAGILAHPGPPVNAAKVLIFSPCRASSASICRCSRFRASESEPIASISPEDTASSPYKTVPTSVAISSVAII